MKYLIVSLLLLLSPSLSYAAEEKKQSLETIVQSAVDKAQSLVPDKSDIMGVLSSAVNNVTEGIQKYGPEAYSAILNILSVQSWSKFIILVILLFYSFYAGRRFIKAIAGAEKAPSNEEGRWFVEAALFGMSGFITSLTFLIEFWDFQMFLGMVDPKLRLFYGILSKFINF